MGQLGRLGEVVQRHDLEILVARGLSQEAPADPPQAIDADPEAHRFPLQPAGRGD